MTPEQMADLVHLRRARDLIDRDHALALDVPATASAEVVPACVSMIASRPRRTAAAV